MYSKEEAAKLKKEFWTAYGQYMSPVPSSEGEKINWINYRTDEKHIRFKTDVDKKIATVSIVFDHPDADIRSLQFVQMQKFKSLLESEAKEEWIWKEGNEESCIYISSEGHSIFNKEDWPSVISFFKQRMIALDAFWNNIKYAFEELR